MVSGSAEDGLKPEGGVFLKWDGLRGLKRLSSRLAWGFRGSKSEPGEVTPIGK